MRFETLFKLLSYLTVLGGFFALWITGTLGEMGSALFLAAAAAAWYLEGRRWQLSERLGTILIVLSLPLYFLFWRTGFFVFSDADSVLPGILARLILTLTAIKLLQRKSDRDWIFLYIMAFFQVLLAAGLSISALYLGAFAFFFFAIICTVIAFEIRRTGRNVSDLIRRTKDTAAVPAEISGAGRIPIVAVGLIVAVVAIAVPTFFVIPRVGGAGIGSSPDELSTRSGFSSVVHLGGIGKIQQSDEIVMRIRVDSKDPAGGLKWRGVALDTFDGESWSVSAPNPHEAFTKGARDVIQLEPLRDRRNLLLQTIYLEPLDTPVIFGASRAIGIQGNFPFLKKDKFGDISYQSRNERISYKVLSDRSVPPDEELREDKTKYDAGQENYLQLPSHLDPRIRELAVEVTAGTTNRLDAARAVETYLKTRYGYTLDLKAGGPNPLADFLFNVREGHCEYFATAMAVMLRTQGIATRIVNGFQQGDYNDAADVFVVRQRHAHSWVEVYFPGVDEWVTFDPTPTAANASANGAGIAGEISKYMEALEMLWIQYFVAFDNQEQRTLFTQVKRGISEYGSKSTSYADVFQKMVAEWWNDVSGENGSETRNAAILYGAAALAMAGFFGFLIVFAYRKIVGLKVWRRLLDRFLGPRARMVDFYGRMIAILSDQGYEREAFQTPIEFAASVDSADAFRITEKYNAVRFGGLSVSEGEAKEIEGWLADLRARGRSGR